MSAAKCLLIDANRPTVLRTALAPSQAGTVAVWLEALVTTADGREAC